jgi:glucuronoarabinoxylan endo-1,4-beta-xylanase
MRACQERRPGLRTYRLVGAALALGLSGCSSDAVPDPVPSSPLSPTPAPGDPNTPTGMPAPESPDDGNGSAPASANSEGQPVTDLITPPGGEPGPGTAEPSDPTMAEPEPVPRPPAELPSTEPTVSGPVDVTVTVNVTQRFQTLVGFGASQVYYVDWITLNPNKDEISEVIFRDLGLDVLRIGNWYQARDMQDPQIQNTIELVQRAQRSLERFPEILMTSWSPPADLKDNGELANGGTLVQRNGSYAYGEFGDWWRESIVAYGAAGVPVTYVGIQNEPDFTAAYDSARFSAAEGQFAGYGQALAAVRERFSTLDAPPALIGPEVIGLNVGNISSYLQNLDDGDLDVVGHHLYSGGDPNAPDSFNASMAQMAGVAAGKPIIMSEFAPEAQGPQFFETAWLIHNALSVEGVSGYLYWALGWRNREGNQPVDPGLVTLEDPRPGAPAFSTEKGYSINPTYYAVKHFSKWLDPGFQRVGASSSVNGLRASAYIDAEDDRVTVVLLNTDGQAHTVSLAMQGFDVIGSSAFRTAGNIEQTAALGALAMQNAVTLPSRSVVTIVLEGAVGN